MSPRVKPRPVSPEKQAAHTAAAADYKRQTRKALAEVVERHGLTPISTIERTAYGPGSKFSYFRDRALAAMDTAARTARDSQGNPVGLPMSYRDNLYGGPEDVQARLASVEQRAGTTTSTQGGGFVPTGVPAYIGDAFAEAARAAAVLTSILPHNPLPDEGMDIHTPRITTGTSAAIQSSQNSANSNTDIVEANEASPVGMVDGYVDISVQLDERADPSMTDVVFAYELGRALGTALDGQILSGTGSNGQTLGITAATGIGTTAYTDASPTQQECFVKILNAASDMSVALGNVPTATLLHPRRLMWFWNWRDSSTTGPSNVIPWPAPVHAVPAIPTTNGAGTNEDFALVLRVEELPVYTAPPVFEVFPQVNSSAGTVRIVARQYVASLAQRRPEAIQKISGTGFGGVAFT